MIIAVDFDGTIVEHKYPAIGKELPFALDSLKRLAMSGHKIVLWTVREGEHLQAAVDWCHEHGLDFYAVNSEFPNGGWSDGGRKVRADIYIDDRNLGGLPDWSTVYDMITMHMTFTDVLQKVAQGEALPESFEVQSGTFQHHHHHHKKSIWRKIKERSQRARNKLR